MMSCRWYVGPLNELFDSSADSDDAEIPQIWRNVSSNPSNNLFSVTSGSTIKTLCSVLCLADVTIGCTDQIGCRNCRFVIGGGALWGGGGRWRFRISIPGTYSAPVTTAR